MKRTLIICLLGFTSLLQAQIISHQYNLRLNPVEDAHYPLSGPGRAYRSALKFDISAIPPGADIKYVHLFAYIVQSEVRWDGDVNYYNINHQRWAETMPADSVELASRSDSTHQDTMFGNFSFEWSQSTDLRQILLRDYTAKNQYCSILMVDPDDTSSVFTPGTPLFDLDSLVVGVDGDSTLVGFLSSESPDPSLQPYLGIRYCFPTDTQLVLNVCDSIHLNGETFTMTGMYTQVIPNAEGCDSTIHIDLTIRHSSTHLITQSGCDSVTVNGIHYFRSGQYTQTFVNAVGCDSLLILQLTVHKSYTILLNLEACDSVVVNGQVYKTSGKYFQHLTSSKGCDSTIVVDAIIHTATFGNKKFTGCDSLEINNEWFTSSGTYIQVLTNSKGCDSILTLDLTINHSSSGVLDLTDCDSASVNGKKYYKSGVYTQKLTNFKGCDSLLTIHLTLGHSTVDSLSYTACNGIVINNITYTQSGTYTQNLQSKLGCDSVLVLDITIHNSTTAAVQLTGCDSIVVNNQVYDSSGIYNQILTNSKGCDSLLILTLTVNHSSFSTLQVNACDSIAINGVVYQKSGVYTQKLTNAAQCDSTLIIQLEIGKSTIDSLAISLCQADTINGQFIDSTGYYTQVLVNADGCDSVLLLYVEIVTIDTSVTVNGFTLSSNEAGATYQWVDCNNNYAAIPGEDKVSFQPTVPGTYAVIIKHGNCTDTSACYPVVVVGTKDPGTQVTAYVYPNPSNGQLVIRTAGDTKLTAVRLYHSNGRFIRDFSVTTGPLHQYDVRDLRAGLYFLELISEEGRYLVKWVKE